MFFKSYRRKTFGGQFDPFGTGRVKPTFHTCGILHAERHFLLFKDQLAENGRQKTKENIILRGKFRLVENDAYTKR